jgi:hypothetical protein
VLLVALLSALAACSPAFARRVLAQDAAQDASGEAPFCRFGVNLWRRGDVREFDLAGLRAGWYVDYVAPGPAHPPALDYAPVLFLRQVGADGYEVGKSWAAIDALLAANPGARLMIGNEPDRRDFQDDMAPAAYAAAYHDFYYYVKGRDPTAQVLAGNIVQPTPLRLQYLDLVLDAYRTRYGEEMPVDAWSIHNYILNERSCAVHPDDCWGADIPPGIEAAEGLVIGVDETDRIDLFFAHIERFRRWMAERGYRDRPLYVTEFGVLMPPNYGYEPARVNAFMRKAFDYMLRAADLNTGYAPDANRLVQRFSWYAVVEPQFNGGLWESTSPTDPAAAPFVITPIGAAYRDYTAAVIPTQAIGVVSATVAPPLPPAPASVGALAAGEEHTATLTLRLGNAGNLRSAAQVRVTVYDGLPDPSKQPLAPPQTVSLSGCGEAATLTFHWRSSASGATTGILSLVVEAPQGTTVHTVAYFAARTELYLPYSGR